jgi:formamidopyrimidine-DNA glycosylase
MPELPDITLYIEALETRILHRVLLGVRLGSPFLLRSVAPPLDAFFGRPVVELRRLGKRIVFCFPGDDFLILHLMIAGRLHWRESQAKIPGKVGLAAFDFAEGTLTLTEAGSKRRASLYAARGRGALAEHDRGGAEVLEIGLPDFSRALTRENHTLKRALADPRLFSGIGNAYSDEILHRARLSPLKRSDSLSAAEVDRLFAAARATLSEWIDRLRREAAGAFPEKVTAFRKGMAVHGRYKLPCPDCGTSVARIVHAENETNYCPKCQTGGRLLADRSLSRLLRDDWPRSLDELEERREALRDRSPMRST